MRSRPTDSQTPTLAQLGWMDCVILCDINPPLGCMLASALNIRPVLIAPAPQEDLHVHAAVLLALRGNNSCFLGHIACLPSPPVTLSGHARAEPKCGIVSPLIRILSSRRSRSTEQRSRAPQLWGRFELHSPRPGRGFRGTVEALGVACGEAYQWSREDAQETLHKGNLDESPIRLTSTPALKC